MGNSLTYHLDRENNPYDEAPLEFDPHYGFPEGARQQKKRRATLDEIESMQVPYSLRDYCLHKVLEAQVCYRHNHPWIYKCAHRWHEYALCDYEEAKDRMKDYERERRLLQRRKRILKVQADRAKKRAAEEALANAVEVS